MTQDAPAEKPVPNGGGIPPSGAGPAWKTIADTLLARIRSGELAEGDALPTVLDLAEAHGVNRHTVRRAFHHLQEQGFISVEQGRGSFVRQRPLLYRLGRRVSFSANLRGAGIAASNRLLLNARSISAQADVAAALKLPSGTSVWRFQTLSAADAKPVSFSIHHVSAARFAGLPEAIVRAGASITAMLKSYGIEDYERLSTRILARGAGKSEAARLDIAVGAPILVSISIDGLGDGTPLHLVESAFNPERIEFLLAREGF
ncbi:phosphonate metabolism transcriptional regulator PhnF [Methylovirgula sp. 4M-Z18]|uniref:phosphonate metabolism transcriptional regulator PhnF n=1 Tax=Methylovirgula sp. 4M-Z18 TaxID=2293567 RepID=UPI000E2EDA90|nr:phosphonate metabolism transcriptional regulator PhnF [Methylovirgula sp. 4M-Z18]RFB81247.1 phosphonate metabolism transcriptional regulator PhnF [Methylovirgula sp. 4M-Z18]